MLAKSWKRIGLIILIIACVWNVTSKLVDILSFDRAIDDAKAYIQSIRKDEEKQDEKTNVLESNSITNNI